MVLAAVRTLYSLPSNKNNHDLYVHMRIWVAAAPDCPIVEYSLVSEQWQMENTRII